MPHNNEFAARMTIERAEAGNEIAPNSPSLIPYIVAAAVVLVVAIGAVLKYLG